MILRRLTFLLAVIVMLPITAISAAERDPLAPVFSMEPEPFAAFPGDLIAQPNQEAITALVNESRQFGVPVAVRVVSSEEGHEHLPELDDLSSDERIPEETMRELARSWMADEPIESSPGAADGFLMLVTIPEDQTRSSAVIEPAANALPLNGLTQQNIDEVINTLVLPSFDQNEVSQGIRSGLSVFSYNNLFGKPERIGLDDLHEDLQMVAGIPLAGATALSSLAILALAWWISRRTPTPVNPDEESSPLSPFAAAALRAGRVNDAVATGGMLELVRRGMIRTSEPGGGSITITTTESDTVDDPFLQSLLDTLRANAKSDGTVRPSARRRMQEITVSARSALEDDLATRGLFNRDGRVETMWLILASMLSGGVALFTLLPSLLGMARIGIAAIALAIIVIAGVLVWAARRSWTTVAGEEALAAWERSATVQDREAFDTIVHQDDLISTVGGPLTPATVSLVRSLRGMGAS